MELIAHRAANEPHLVAPALAVADIVELDLHLFRRRLEVRHAKVIWPFAVFWEKWHLVPGTPHPPLGEILDVTPDDAHLWFDLKGFTTRLPNRLLREVGVRDRMTVSCRSWWALRPVRRAGGVRTFRSVANSWQLWLVQRVRFADHDDGVVMHERLATPDTIARLRQLTRHVVVWAVDDLDRALELHRLGASGIIADDLDLLAAVGRRVDAGEGGAEAPN